MIDRREKIQIAKATEANNKFLPGFTFDFSFIPGWNISCSRDFFQTRSARLKFPHVISPLISNWTALQEFLVSLGDHFIVSWNVNLNHVDCVSCVEEGG